jgi:hypothetical protein
MKQVICMKWGTLYGPEYVNILYAMVRKNLTAPFCFVCLTDDATGLNPAIETFPCPTVPLPAPHHNRGWRKVSLFAPAARLFGLKGDWLYLDLDVVISGSLDDFFTFAREKNFVVMQNWTQPGKGIGNTSVYRFRVGADTYLLSDLVSRPQEILSTYRNSQTYLSKNVREITFWPDQWCVLFKTHCLPGWPQRLWKPPVLPPKARVVAFPGLPNPPQAARGEWPSPPWKKLYKTLRPAPWIEELWRDDL